MKKIIIFVAAFATTIFMSIGVSAADAPFKLTLDGVTLQWADEFSGNELNNQYWTPQLGDGYAYGGTNLIGWGNREKQNYKAENVFVSDGTMKIVAKYEPTTYMNRKYNWTSARIASNNSSVAKVGLGYVEARIKIPSSVGIWPAFWMLGDNGKVWPANGEIDIMEAFNTRPTLQSTIHYPSWTGKDVYAFAYTNSYDKTQWHTFGCYRDGSQIAFYIDRTLLKSYSTSDLTTSAVAGKRSVLNENYYVLFNVACGGNLAGGTPPTDPNWSATMEVDYVRYYRMKTADELVADSKKHSQPTTQAPTKVSKPAKAKISKIKNIKRKKIKLTFKKIKNVKGYQVRWCDNKKFRGYEQKNTSKTNLSLKGLDKNTKYYVKVRAYRVSGKTKIYGAWSGVKKVTVKK